MNEYIDGMGERNHNFMERSRRAANALSELLAEMRSSEHTSEQDNNAQQSTTSEY